MSRHREGQRKVVIKEKRAITRKHCDRCKDIFKLEKYWRIKFYTWDYDGGCLFSRYRYKQHSVWYICKKCAPEKEMLEVGWTKETGWAKSNVKVIPQKEVEEKKEKEVKDAKSQVDQLVDFLLENPNKNSADFNEQLRSKFRLV